MRTIVNVSADVFYFNCTVCGGELWNAEQRESGWCGCGRTIPENEKQRKARLLSRGKPFIYKRNYVLNALRGFVKERGKPPTLREFGRLLGVSPDAASEYLRHLEESGDVIRTRKNRRGVMVKGCEKFLRPEPPKEKNPREAYKRLMSKEELAKRIDRVVAEAKRREAEEGEQVLGQLSRSLRLQVRGASKIG